MIGGISKSAITTHICTHASTHERANRKKYGTCLLKKGPGAVIDPLACMHHDRDRILLDCFVE